MILITGASGRIARRTAELLSGRRTSLRLMSRNPDQVPKLAEAEVVQGDFREPETLDKAFAGITVAFVVSAKAPPGQRAEMHKSAFTAAARAGVGHVVYLSLKRASSNSLYPFCRDHHRSEQYLAESGVPYTSLRIAFYLDMFIDKFDPHGVIRGPAGSGRGAFISREDTAWAAAAVVAAPAGGTFDITGPELLSVDDVARRLSAISGKVLRYKEESIQETRKRMGQTGISAWMLDLEAGWFQAIGAGEQSPVSDAYRRLAGRNPLSLEDYFSAFPERLGALCDDGTPGSFAQVS